MFNTIIRRTIGKFVYTTGETRAVFSVSRILYYVYETKLLVEIRKFVVIVRRERLKR